VRGGFAKGRAAAQLAEAAHVTIPSGEHPEWREGHGHCSIPGFPAKVDYEGSGYILTFKMSGPGKTWRNPTLGSGRLWQAARHSVIHLTAARHLAGQKELGRVRDTSVMLKAKKEPRRFGKTPEP
jgi:hypothetical protein